VAVVGVFVQRDKNSKLSTPLLNDLPESSGELVTLDGTRNPSDFLPRSRKYFSYSGSFTTPPCTEGIRWIVMKQPIGVAPEVVDRFAAILRSNNRPVQMLNNRIVERSE
jgi:carbonic anhydrase